MSAAVTKRRLVDTLCPAILVAQGTPANAAGTIQFKDGDSELGPPRPVFGCFALAVTSKLTQGRIR